MLRKLIKGTLAGGIILYLWMMISWVALPWHDAFFETFTHEEEVAAAIRQNAHTRGVYLLPSVESQLKSGDQAAMMARGPIVFAGIQPDGTDVYSPRLYITSFVSYLITACFATFLFLQVRPLDYWRKVAFVTAFGIAAGILVSVPNWIWWGYSFGYTMVTFLDMVIAWFLVGLALARIHVPKQGS